MSIPAPTLYRFELFPACSDGDHKLCWPEEVEDDKLFLCSCSCHFALEGSIPAPKGEDKE